MRTTTILLATAVMLFGCSDEVSHGGPDGGRSDAGPLPMIWPSSVVEVDGVDCERFDLSYDEGLLHFQDHDCSCATSVGVMDCVEVPSNCPETPPMDHELATDPDQVWITGDCEYFDVSCSMVVVLDVGPAWYCGPA